MVFYLHVQKFHLFELFYVHSLHLHAGCRMFIIIAGWNGALLTIFVVVLAFKLANYQLCPEYGDDGFGFCY